MKAWIPCSGLAVPIERFTALRRLSGTDYHSQARRLGYFDRFLVEQNVPPSGITREIWDRYQDNLAGLAPRSRANRLCVVRQLCKYLARTDRPGFVPEPVRGPPSRGAHPPHIFTQRQVRALLAAASRLPPSGSLRPLTFHTLLGLLYATGLRIGEALALNIEHFFPGEQRLYVAEGKFRKSRWLVLSASTNRALEQYLAQRLGKAPDAPDAPLLLNERHQRLCHPTVYAVFCALLVQCGIKDESRTGPRLHDLRHSFAVHRLLAWYRDGADVNARLPALATYMGHVNISSTQVYLQPTAELLGEVDRRFHDHYLNHLVAKGARS
jgi:site-specific recombinase XerD